MPPDLLDHPSADFDRNTTSLPRCSREFLDYLRQAGLGSPVGFEVNERVRKAIRALPGDAWAQALTQDGAVRRGAAAAGITNLVDLSGYPAGSRVIVRREPLRPGAAQTLFDIDGKRFTAFLTGQPDADLAGMCAIASTRVSRTACAARRAAGRATWRVRPSSATRCGCSW